jgi:predicted phage terminase large subunit-like protein
MAVRAWDLAATADENGSDPDWTVGLKLMRQTSGEYVVLDVVRLRGGPRRVEEAITSTARADGMQVIIGLPEDPGQAGKSQIAYLASRLSGHQIIPSRESGSKSTRATPVASQMGSNNMTLLRASWNHTLVEELRDFPYAKKDDQVDALSRAFNMFLEIGSGARGTFLSHMNR